MGHRRFVLLDRRLMNQTGTNQTAIAAKRKAGLSVINSASPGTQRSAAKPATKASTSLVPVK